MDEKKLIHYAENNREIYKMWVNDDRTLIVSATLTGFDQIAEDLHALVPGIKIIDYMDYRDEPVRQIYGEGIESYNLIHQREIEAPRRKPRIEEKHVNDDTHVQAQIPLRSNSHEVQYQKSLSYSQKAPRNGFLKVIKVLVTLFFIVALILDGIAVFIAIDTKSSFQLCTFKNHQVAYFNEKDKAARERIAVEDLQNDSFLIFLSHIYLGFDTDGEIRDVSLVPIYTSPYFYKRFDVKDDYVEYVRPIFLRLDDPSIIDNQVYCEVVENELVDYMTIYSYNKTMETLRLFMTLLSILSFVMFIIVISLKSSGTSSNKRHI